MCCSVHQLEVIVCKTAYIIMYTTSSTCGQSTVATTSSIPWHTMPVISCSYKNYVLRLSEMLVARVPDNLESAIQEEITLLCSLRIPPSSGI